MINLEVEEKRMKDILDKMSIKEFDDMLERSGVKDDSRTKRRHIMTLFEFRRLVYRIKIKVYHVLVKVKFFRNQRWFRLGTLQSYNNYLGFIEKEREIRKNKVSVLRDELEKMKRESV